MTLRTASLLLTGLLAGGLAQAQAPSAAAPLDPASFNVPEEPINQQGYVIATLVANMRACGAGEQPLTTFYNHEKRQALDDFVGQANVAQDFDAGFVLGSAHMRAIAQGGKLTPDRTVCQALGQRLMQVR